MRRGGQYLGELYNPVFSPDGTQIAYFDGMGDWGHSLRVMRSDGTRVKVLWDDSKARHISDLGLVTGRTAPDVRLPTR